MEGEKSEKGKGERKGGREERKKGGRSMVYLHWDL